MSYNYIHGRLLKYLEDDVRDLDGTNYISKMVIDHRMMMYVLNVNHNDIKSINNWLICIEICMYIEGWIESPEINELDNSITITL